MKLCAVSDSLGSLSFNEAAKASADLGLEAMETGMGNWSAAPHADLQSLLERWFQIDRSRNYEHGGTW